MKKKNWIAGALSVSLLASMPYAVTAEAPQKQWTNVNAYEEADGSPFNSEHYDFVKYSKIGEILQKFEKESKRVTLEQRGTSSDGYPMYVVTISNPEDKGKYGHNKKLRKQMFKNPQKAQDWIAENPDFKVPVMINGSIHGTEYIGSDAVLQLIDRFANDNDAETNNILKSNILIFNVVANPDGRVDGTRFNGNGIDLNRDFITQSQEETKQTVDLITEWNPMVFLDLHGYVNSSDGKPGLIEPCTPPHNPNYEYDLFSKWALDQAEAMESEIVGNKTNYESDHYKNMTGTYIPQRDDSAGWDDYPPIFTPMYAMYHGAYGYTLEAPTNSWDGVRWANDAVMGALKFATDNKQGMLTDQIEIFERGINFDHPYHEEGFFPNAYVLPVNEKDPTVTEKAVNHFLENDISVEKATKAFSANGQTYPAGTYIVDMSQAKAGLANTMLWDGEDITNDTPAMYDISAWSLPELWGFEAIEVKEELKAKTAPVKEADYAGSINGKGPYVISNSSVQAVKLVNDLVKAGESVYKGNDEHFYVETLSASNKTLVKKSGISLETAKMPAQKEKLSSLKVAILKDGGMNKAQSHAGTKLALDRLGFSVTEVTPTEVAEKGLSQFDAFLYSGTDALLQYENVREANKPFVVGSKPAYESFKTNVQTFINNGGKYIAVGAGGAKASSQLGITSVKVNTGNANSNGIVKVNNEKDEVTTGYNTADLGFVYRPVWFTELGNAKSVATLASGDFFVAGHWKGNEQAAGQAVIVEETGKDVTLIGLEAGFRDHTDYLFRLLSNALYQ
ncbi:M14 family zinc carboxypeptidase [Fictibacillus sp. b24]|uniref:M14 family zinc carboxypeptidase n=1 Tax=Fictibacillus sp. b24 TaxID=3055863 RepID=UPI0025A1B25F|nr:M14 family zinc carboxypeptidase [Fictibacillus sp. b24]MDM5314572.1 M14 family zinc carboxypeptidase [Fictibacillus sp. b24]